MGKRARQIQGLPLDCAFREPDGVTNALGKDDAELRQQPTEHVDHLGPLPDNQTARSVQRKNGLLFRRFHIDEPHGRTGDGFADRLRIIGIVLVALYVGLHKLWGHQLYGKTPGLEMTRPMIRTCTGFHANHTTWLDFIQ